MTLKDIETAIDYSDAATDVNLDLSTIAVNGKPFKIQVTHDYTAHEIEHMITLIQSDYGIESLSDYQSTLKDIQKNSTLNVYKIPIQIVLSDEVPVAFTPSKITVKRDYITTSINGVLQTSTIRVDICK